MQPLAQSTAVPTTAIYCVGDSLECFPLKSLADVHCSLLEVGKLFVFILEALSRVKLNGLTAFM